MKIHDLPCEERPREKLALRGPEALTDAELLAIFIRTGTRKKNAMELAKDMLLSYGSLARLAQVCHTPQELVASVSGIGMAKACELCAAIEMASRIRRASALRESVESAQKAWEFFGVEMQNYDREVLKVVCLDTRLRIILDKNISVGSLSECTAHPREIFREAIIAKAYAILVIHNHPSGDPTPSKNDCALTRQLRECAAFLQIKIIDHVIMGTAEGDRQPFFSFRDAGML